MSDTPQTDLRDAYPLGTKAYGTVDANFARSLERDNNKMRRLLFEILDAGTNFDLCSHIRAAMQWDEVPCPIPTKSLSFVEIQEKWNLRADGYNQWDSLGEDEKIEFAFMVGKGIKDA